jgi:hypothetical protein
MYWQLVFSHQQHRQLEFSNTGAAAASTFQPGCGTEATYNNL